MFIALGIQHANAHAPHGFLQPARICHIFPHYPIRARFSKKDVIEKKMCVLIFSTMFIRKNLLFEEQPSEIPSKVYIGLHVNYPLLLSDFNES
jgi:hypothetical protein